MLYTIDTAKKEIIFSGNPEDSQLQEIYNKFKDEGYTMVSEEVPNVDLSINIYDGYSSNCTYSENSYFEQEFEFWSYK